MQRKWVSLVKHDAIAMALYSLVSRHVLTKTEMQTHEKTKNKIAGRINIMPVAMLMG